MLVAEEHWILSLTHRNPVLMLHANRIPNHTERAFDAQPCNQQEQDKKSIETNTGTNQGLQNWDCAKISPTMSIRDSSQQRNQKLGDMMRFTRSPTRFIESRAARFKYFFLFPEITGMKKRRP